MDAPIAFQGGKITTANGIQFSRDGRTLYTSQNRESLALNGKPLMGIYERHFEENHWSAPRRIQLHPDLDAYHPVLSVDNRIMFFNSRSKPDTIAQFIPHNIWYVSREDTGWSAPQMLPEVNGPLYDSYPSVAKNNNLYFNSNRPGGQGGMDIYLSTFVNGQYQIPVNLSGLNSPHEENDLVVDPNERFIIFNRYVHDTQEIELFLSLREGDDWGTPTLLNKVNAPNQWELTPTLSPDGKYFFYEVDGKVMQCALAALLPSRE